MIFDFYKFILEKVSLNPNKLNTNDVILSTPKGSCKWARKHYFVVDVSSYITLRPI